MAALLTKVWLDPWIPSNVDFKPIPRSNIIIDLDLLVKDHFLHNTRTWNAPLLFSLFDQQTIRSILKIHVSE